MQASLLVFFADVVDAGSFSAAARRMGLDRSNISRRIHELERQLGCQLLRRSTRSMQFTEAGAFFYERCCVVRAEVDYAHKSLLDLSGDVRGKLTVSCPPMLGREVIAPLLVEFCNRYSLVDLKIKLKNYVGDLIPEKIDLCITVTDGPAPDVVARPLAHVDWLVCSSPAYLADRPMPRQPEDLASVAWVGQLERDTLELAGPKGPERTRIKTRMECVDLHLVRRALVEGMGAGVLPDYIAAPALQDGSLVQLLQGYTAQGMPGSTLYAITLPTRYMPSKVKALVEFVVEAFARRGAG